MPEPRATARSGPDAVIVLAGGAGRRLGGVDKGALLVAGRTLLDGALAAAGRPAVVVGKALSTPAGVVQTWEDPPGGGPAAAVAAGVAALFGRRCGQREGVTAVRPADALAPVDSGCANIGSVNIDSANIHDESLIGVLAVDQPGVTAATLARLADAVRPDPSGGAVLMHDGRRQYAVGVFRAGPLARAVAGRPSWHGASLRSLLDPLVSVEVLAVGDEAWDVDTEQDLARWRSLAPGSCSDRPAG